MSEDFRVLARRRLEEGRALFEAGHFSGAYYLAGYATECALKAVALSHVQPFIMPDRKLIEKMFTHSIKDLVVTAGLGAALDERHRQGDEFAINWGIAKDWNESSRYESFSRDQAEELLSAIERTGDGVFEWIEGFW